MPGSEATKITPTSSEESPGASPKKVQSAARKRTRRLSFADEYDGGKLENTVLCNNLHYSKEPAPDKKNSGSGGNMDGGDGGGCCVIS